jgi:2-hydroxychromene-2-carboxylate isomerase
MATVEFFYDLSSPWTCLAFHNIQPILSETGAAITWRPFLVGGVFNAVNKTVYAGRANPDDRKVSASFKWLADWARLSGVPMNFPSPYHPLQSVSAMRFCCVLEPNQEKLFEFTGRAFDAYFRDGRNLDDLAVLVELADKCGLDGHEMARLIQTDEVKRHLWANTQELIDRGGFGAPTIFVDRTDMYFGNDQLPIVRFALLRGAPAGISA